MTPFETLMEEYHGEIYRYLLRVTGTPSDAADLSQETFLRAFRAYRSLPPATNTRAWLFAIATNLSKNHFRGLSRRRGAYEKVAGLKAGRTHSGGDGPDGVALSREMGAMIERLLSNVPLRQRIAFVQRKIHGFDYDLIGRSLGCSAESARAHVFQAMKKIRRGLNGYMRGTEER